MNKKYIINTFNDFDKLNSIIIGRALSKDIKIQSEIDEDRNNLINILNQFKVNVINVPNYFYNTCVVNSPRDNILTLGNKIIECSVINRDRTPFYTKHCDIIFETLNIIENNQYIKMPESDFISEFDNISHKLKFKDSVYFNKIYKVLNKFTNTSKIQIDGANILKCGKDIFVNISTINNILGFYWLKEQFKEYNFNWHPLSITYHHIDGTITIIKPGLLLLHNGLINCWENILPKQFHKWDKIFYDSMDIENFKNDYLGSKLLPGTTDINLLSIDREHILVYDYNYKDISDKLKKYNIEAIPISLRHHNVWAGGLHCISCDINRDSVLENYF